MATPREIRRLAFQALYQIDARGGADPEHVRDSMEEPPGFTPKERDAAFKLAMAAFEAREAADGTTRELAPTWPAHRQAAVDRAILRLAHYEMTSGRTHPKVAVNEAVELAKEFSTDRSPAFVNGLLDKILKRILAERGETAEAPAAGAEAAEEPPVSAPDQPPP